MFNWTKQGFIYKPEGENNWDQHSFMTPTPVALEGGIIRVFGGFRDNAGVSRIGYIDVSTDNPSNIIDICTQPVLDTGLPGMFDDNGMILGDVVFNPKTSSWLMFYVGFQLVQQAKFLAFTGIAESKDCLKFERVSNTPFMDRVSDEPYIRAVHGVNVNDESLELWYSADDGWYTSDKGVFPKYYVRRAISSLSGTLDPNSIQTVLTPAADEYRLGRSRVHNLSENTRLMTFTMCKSDLVGFGCGAALSSDGGKNWSRDDSLLGFDGLDHVLLQDVTYPALLKSGDKVYMFYNRGDFGKSGLYYLEGQDIHDRL